jgi:cytochrome c oxidase subunit II
MRKQNTAHRHSVAPPARKRGLALPVRVGAFVALSLTIALAVFLVWPRTPTATAAQRVTVDMAGFHPANLTATAGQPMQIQIINPDSSMHSDGGGWHELAIPGLGIDARIAPRSDKTIDIPATAPGEYAFYCDVCCGGKDNPSMQGVLKVTA